MSQVRIDYEYDNTGILLYRLKKYWDSSLTFEKYFYSGKVTTSSVSVDKEKLFKCFPNPSSGIVNVSVGNTTNAKLNVYTLEGKSLNRKFLCKGDNLIGIEGNNFGVYIFEITSRDEAFEYKILKK